MGEGIVEVGVPGRGPWGDGLGIFREHKGPVRPGHRGRESEVGVRRVESLENHSGRETELDWVPGQRGGTGGM